MKARGGYQILNLNTDLSSNAGSNINIEGAYKLLQNSHGKPVMLSEITVDGVKQNDVFITPEKSVDKDNYYIYDLYGFDLTIAEDDTVTINVKPAIPKKLYKYSVVIADTSLSSTKRVTAYVEFITKKSDVDDAYFRAHMKEFLPLKTGTQMPKPTIATGYMSRTATVGGQEVTTYYVVECAGVTADNIACVQGRKIDFTNASMGVTEIFEFNADKTSVKLISTINL